MNGNLSGAAVSNVPGDRVDAANFYATQNWVTHIRYMVGVLAGGIILLQ